MFMNITCIMYINLTYECRYKRLEVKKMSNVFKMI